MARYIDAVELIKAIEENQRNTEHHKDGRGKQIHISEHRHFIKMVYEQPTADVVEVVRCKDCVHRDPEDKKCDGAFQAKCGMLPMDDNDFCSYGERRKEDGKIY